jgi:hypothetical protein
VVRGLIDLLVVETDKATVIERLPGPPGAEQRSRMEIVSKPWKRSLPDGWLPVSSSSPALPGSGETPRERRGAAAHSLSELSGTISAIHTEQKVIQKILDHLKKSKTHSRDPPQP